MSDIVEVIDEGHVRYIRLNRPEKKNAVNEALAWGVLKAIEGAQSNDDVWAIGLTGNGDSFCAGLDLSGRGDSASSMGPVSERLDDIGWVGRFLLQLRQDCDRPIVGGINGVAVGAGLGLAMATDIRLAARSASFFIAASSGLRPADRQRH